MCRTIAQITEDHPIVKRMDRYIAKNGDEKDTLLMEVSRHNFISSEQSKDDRGEIMEYVEDAKKSPSIIWLLKNRFIKTFAVLITLAISIYIVFHLVEYSVGFAKMVEGFLP